MSKVSLDPKTFTEGSGLKLDGADVTIKEARWEFYDYNGKSPAPVPCLKVAFEDDDSELHEQFYSVGSADHFEPSDDGLYLEAIGTRNTLNSAAAAAIFLKYAAEAGIDIDKVGEDISELEGVKAHTIAIEGRKYTDRRTGEEKKSSSLIVIDKLVEDRGSSKRGSSGKARGGSGQATTASDQSKATKAPKKAKENDLVADAESCILAILENNGGSVKKNNLPKDMKKELDSHPEALAIIKLAWNPEFLEDSERPWSYNDGVISI